MNKQQAALTPEQIDKFGREAFGADWAAPHHGVHRDAAIHFAHAVADAAVATHADPAEVAALRQRVETLEMELTLAEQDMPLMRDEIVFLKAQLAQQVPDGWQLVPKKPTAEMQAAGTTACTFETTLLNRMFVTNRSYRAMLAAAPQEQK